MTRKLPRAAGVAARSGVSPARPGRHRFRASGIAAVNAARAVYPGEGPKPAERRKPLFAANRRTPDIAAHVMAKLRAASRGGKGICALSKAELAVVLAKIRSRRRRRTWRDERGNMP